MSDSVVMTRQDISRYDTHFQVEQVVTREWHNNVTSDRVMIGTTGIWVHVDTLSHTITMYREVEGHHSVALVRDMVADWIMDDSDYKDMGDYVADFVYAYRDLIWLYPSLEGEFRLRGQRRFNDAEREVLHYALARFIQVEYSTRTFVGTNTTPEEYLTDPKTPSGMKMKIVAALSMFATCR